MVGTTGPTVAADGSPVTVDDVPKRWLNDFLDLPPGNPALHENQPDAVGHVAGSSPKATFEVPVRDDDVQEGGRL